MSFEPFQFVYTPPPTVNPEPAPALSAAQVASLAGPSIGQASAAAQLAQRFTDLAATSTYLQSVLSSLTAGVAVTIDAAVHPEFELAFTSVYPAQAAPASIPIWLYNHWVNADIGVMQLNMALGNQSPLDVNLKQAADYSQLTRTVDSALLDNGSYLAQLPLLLRPLKTDTVVFTSWAEGLAAYPAALATGTTSAVPPTDISPELNTYLTSVADRTGQAYAGTYSLAVGPGHVNADLEDIVNTMVLQPLHDLIRVVALLNGARGLFVKGALKDLFLDVANFGFAQLAAEAGNMVMMADRFGQGVTAPLRQASGGLGALLNQAQAYANIVGAIPAGGLKGLASANSCSTGLPLAVAHSSAALRMPFLNYSQGLRTLAEQVNLSLLQGEQKALSGIRNFRRVVERKLGVHAGVLDTMCALRSLDSLVSIVSGLVSKPPTTTTHQSVLSSAAANITAQTGTAFVAANGTVLPAPPSIPPPSSAVRSVLTGAGLTSLEV